MASIEAPIWQTLEDYLAEETNRPIRREYWGGAIFQTDQEDSQHSTIVQNLFSALQQPVKRKSLNIFASDMKLQVHVGESKLIYYPDILITNEQFDSDPSYRCQPQVIIEVSSPKTELTDRRSKFLFLRQIESLQEYILVQQSKSQITVFRRENHWQPESLQSPTDNLLIPSLAFNLPLASVYERATS
ncbi:MAG TPA: Uma2 family endonuclease [Verrucomicrobiae bacterium]